jgi:hypothetical protein
LGQKKRTLFLLSIFVTFAKKIFSKKTKQKKRKIISYWLKNQKIGFGGLAFGNLQYPPKGSWKRSPWAVWPRP